VSEWSAVSGERGVTNGKMGMMMIRREGGGWMGISCDLKIFLIGLLGLLGLLAS